MKQAEENQVRQAELDLTASAAAQLKQMLALPENEGKALRLAVEQGGCAGMAYSMTVDESHPQDHVCQVQGVTILTDEFSRPYLLGAVIDYSDALIGGGFKIANPNARRQCGCGKSFAA